MRLVPHSGFATLAPCRIRRCFTRWRVNRSLARHCHSRRGLSKANGGRRGISAAAYGPRLSGRQERAISIRELLRMPDDHAPRSPAPLTAARPKTPLSGGVAVPGDKSVSHRALMFGALAVGRTEITGLLEGEDVLATAAALRAMGAGIERIADGIWRVDGVGVGGLGEPEDVLDLGNSGTSARLLLGIMATHRLTAFVTGDGSLRRRPMQRVIDPLSQFGARFVAREGGRLPLAVTGAADPGPLEYRVPMSSAQGKSAGVVGRANNPRRARVGAEEPDPRPNPGQGR